jgi:hypothetical protein
MLNHNINCDLLLCRIYRLLFILLLAVFAQSPIADAYQDNFCFPSVLFNDLNDVDSPVSINDLKLDDARKSLQALNRASKQNQDNRARLQRALARCCSAGRITKPQLPANDNCSSQRCSLASSDPSPPVI